METAGPPEMSVYTRTYKSTHYTAEALTWSHTEVKNCSLKIKLNF